MHFPQYASQQNIKWKDAWRRPVYVHHVSCWWFDSWGKDMKIFLDRYIFLSPLLQFSFSRQTLKKSKPQKSTQKFGTWKHIIPCSTEPRPFKPLVRSSLPIVRVHSPLRGPVYAPCVPAAIIRLWFSMLRLKKCMTKSDVSGLALTSAANVNRHTYILCASTAHFSLNASMNHA